MLKLCCSIKSVENAKNENFFLHTITEIREFICAINGLGPTRCYARKTRFVLFELNNFYYLKIVAFYPSSSYNGSNNDSDANTLRVGYGSRCASVVRTNTQKTAKTPKDHETQPTVSLNILKIV